MPTNNQVLLGEIVRHGAEESPQYSSEDSYFEFFAAQQVLKKYDLSDEEIEQNLTGSGLDGGCDGIFFFADGELVHEDDDDSKFKQDVKLTLSIIQAKNNTSFGEDAFNKWKTVSANLLALDRPCSEFSGRYAESVLQAFSFFKDTYIHLIRKRSKLQIEYKYVSKGTEIHPNVRAQAEELKQLVKAMFPSPSVSVKVSFVGADQLMEIVDSPSDTDFYLELAEVPINLAPQKVYVALVNLSDYYKFITSESGDLIKHIFESNVRDYQGHITVNKDIQDSLEHDEGEDFWWLNNGITILAEDANFVTTKELKIILPEIVNGLQTSNEVFNYFSAHPDKVGHETRNLLVRVIVPQSEDSRDKIIFATNSQTSIPKASLRATDSIHRQIELYFKPRDLYYDRRKNYYKNQGKKSTQIISVSFLAQCLMSIVLQRPNFARARPSTLLTDDDAYNRLYNDRQDLATFYAAAFIGKHVDSTLRACGQYSTTNKSDIEFYVIYVVCVRLLGKATITDHDLAGIDLGQVSNDLILDCARWVNDIYLELGGTDKVAKGSTLITAIQKRLSLSPESRQDSVQ
jgi:hypothetical protein